MRRPGFEPGLAAWKAAVITTRPSAHFEDYDYGVEVLNFTLSALLSYFSIPLRGH